MTLLSCNRSSRISRNVLETESFLPPTCKIMTCGFFFKIGIMWWLISAKLTPLKSFTFTKRFWPRMFNFLRGYFIYYTISIRNSTSCCSLKTIEFFINALLLYVVNYLFINFGEACRSACTVLFIFNYLFLKTVSSR